MPTQLAPQENRHALREQAFRFHGRDWPEAARAWEQYRLQFPDDLEGFVFGIVSLRESGQIAGAEQLATLGLEWFVDHPWLLTEQGVTCFFTQDWPEARRRFAHIRRRFPAEVSGYTRGAETALNLGDHTEALALVRAATPLFPDQADTLQQLDQRARWMRSQDWKWTARQFESLGGGCLDGNRWGFGCESAFSSATWGSSRWVCCAGAASAPMR